MTKRTILSYRLWEDSMGIWFTKEYSYGATMEDCLGHISPAEARATVAEMLCVDVSDLDQIANFEDLLGTDEEKPDPR